MTVFTTDSVESADGTTIGFRRTGSGRPLVLVHGGMLASQHFVALAGELAADFEVVRPRPTRARDERTIRRRGHTGC